jgi:hypothetical protein
LKSPKTFYRQKLSFISAAPLEKDFNIKFDSK